MIDPVKKGYEQINGIKMYYEVYGSGKPLVLIHGGAGSIGFDFKEIIPRLYENFQLIGIDLQNHGRSEHRDIPETFEQDAKDVAELLKKLKITKASFWGFSNGGNTVMQVAHQYPEMVEKLVIASSFYKKSGMLDGFFDGMENITFESMPESLKNNFLQLNPDPAALKNMFEKDSKRMQTFADWSDDILKGIKVPVLLISGDKDVMKPEHTVKMWRLMKGAQLMILSATHGSYMMADFEGNIDEEMIDFTTSEVEKFLNGK